MTRIDLDSRVAAVTARSIMSCARDVDLSVQGLPDPLAGEPRLGMIDADGVPTFLCTPGGALAEAARSGAGAVVTVTGDLPDDEVAGIWSRLSLAGTLRSVGIESCTCCVETRERLILDLDIIQLRRDLDGGEAKMRVQLSEFRSRAYALNPGYLQRAAIHARDAHQDELREAAAALTRVDPDQIAGAQLGSLTTGGLMLEWVDLQGSHQHVFAGFDSQ